MTIEINPKYYLGDEVYAEIPGFGYGKGNITEIFFHLSKQGTKEKYAYKIINSNGVTLLRNEYEVFPTLEEGQQYRARKHKIKEQK